MSARNGILCGATIFNCQNIKSKLMRRNTGTLFVSSPTLQKGSYLSVMWLVKKGGIQQPLLLVCDRLLSIRCQSGRLHLCCSHGFLGLFRTLRPKIGSGSPKACSIDAKIRRPACALARFSSAQTPPGSATAAMIITERAEVLRGSASRSKRRVHEVKMVFLNFHGMINMFMSQSS